MADWHLHWRSTPDGAKLPERTMPATMKSIARDLGVSVVTVSKVLHNHADISAETRKRVLRRMKEVNYQPNLAARALSTGRTSLIGLIVPDLVHPFFAQVAKGISACLSVEGYSLIISSSEENPELERREIEQMMARGVDALILASTESEQSSLRKLTERKMPFVLLDRKIAGLTANFVGIDDVQTGRMATKHLIEIGCKRIAHIGGSKVSTARERKEGYEATLAEHGLKLSAEYAVRHGRGDDAGGAVGYEGMQNLLRLNPRPDGVFCCNDPIAMGAIRAVLEAGLRIPEDIAIVGCGNVHYDDLLRVPLSSVDQDAAGLGENAAKLALQIIKGKDGGSVRNVLLPTTLIIRASTRR
jgi:LacI family transcriptional regulator